MPIFPLILIVLSAILHSTWNMLLKRNHASFASYVLMYIPDLILWGHLQFWSPIALWHMPPVFYALVVCSICSDLLYGQSLLVAYNRMDMSIAYPMMRSLPIILTMIITTCLNLGSPISPKAATGMIIVFIGCLLMPLKTFSEFTPRRYLDKNIFLVFLVALGTTGYTLFDKLAMNHITQASPEGISPLMQSISYYSIRSLFLNIGGWTTGLLVPRYRKGILPTIKSHGGSVLVAGICSSFTYVLVLIAMIYVTNASFIQVFRQIGLPIGLFMAILFLHEKCTLTKVVGVALILTGLALCVA